VGRGRSRPLEPALAPARQPDRGDRALGRPRAVGVPRPGSDGRRDRGCGRARRRQCLLGSSAAGADRDARRRTRGAYGRRAQLDDVQPCARGGAGDRGGCGRVPRHSGGLRAQRSLVLDLRRRPTLHRPAAAAVRRTLRGPPACEPRHPAPQAAARGLPADRSGGRLRLRPGKHARARVGARVRAEGHHRRLHHRCLRCRRGDRRLRGGRPRRRESAADVLDAPAARRRNGRLLADTVAAARAAAALRRRLRLPRLEHTCHLAAAARRRAVGTRADHGPLERGVPGTAAVCEHRRRCDRKRLRCACRRRSPGAPGTRLRRLDGNAGSDARVGPGARRAPAAAPTVSEPGARSRRPLRTAWSNAAASRARTPARPAHLRRTSRCSRPPSSLARCGRSRRPARAAS
jgi:hypothetical protein